MKATAYLLHGFVGAGKTTFARQLEQRHRAQRFTHDEWMHRLYGANPPKQHFVEYARRIDDILWPCALRVLELGVDIVMDTGFWTRASRDSAKARVEASGGRAMLYAITCPEAELRRRVLERTRDVPVDSLWINEEAFDLFKTQFEPVADDEEAIVIDGRGLVSATFP